MKAKIRIPGKFMHMPGVHFYVSMYIKVFGSRLVLGCDLSFWNHFKKFSMSHEEQP